MFPIWVSRKTGMKNLFIKSQHPKSNISPAKIQDLLSRGWVAQEKINGHRLQIHISLDGITCYTRQGTKHTQKLSPELIEAFQAYCEYGWAVFDSEWHKPTNQVFIFDILRLNNETLNSKTISERFKILKSIFRIAPNIKLIKCLGTAGECMNVMQDNNSLVEGLVFKLWESTGWSDDAILRCLKKDLK